MKIVHFSSELAPVAKVGGLGDVLHGLSRALLAEGHDVEVFIPKYDLINLDQIVGLKLTHSFEKYSIWHGTVENIPVRLIESGDLFNRSAIYGCADDALRFTSFCKYALDFLERTRGLPDVLHLHDWHTAIAAPFLKEKYINKKTRCIFTIHNLTYQGICDSSPLEQVGWKNESIKTAHGYNLMKAGLIYSDHVTTVSPNYANEIVNTNLGGELQSTLKGILYKFSGILNGIDDVYWDPDADPSLPSNFSFHKIDEKKNVKKELCKKLSIEITDKPLVAAVTRLVPQKGPELIKSAMFHTLRRGGQFVLIGAASDEKTESEFSTLKKELSVSRKAHLELCYNEDLAHFVFGGSDIFIVPSIVEPCGLTPLIAMRYGSVPLVRATGGLFDIVSDGRNGFSFERAAPETINMTLDRAFSLWNTDSWAALMRSCMLGDYSWRKPAKQYLKIYAPLNT